VVIDAVRYLKVAKEMGIIGCLRGPSAFTQKSPPKQLTYEVSYAECEALANRQLTDITKRQLTKKDAIVFAWEEFNSGGMDYLRLINE
jgi:myo-inositol-1-phosphate synthase